MFNFFYFLSNFIIIIYGKLTKKKIYNKNKKESY